MTRSEQRHYIRNHLACGDLFPLLATRTSLVAQCIENPKFEPDILIQDLEELKDCLMLLYSEFDLEFADRH